MEFLVPLMIGLVVGLIVLFSLLSQLKSVVQKHEASDYIAPGSLHLTERQDRFVDKHTERQMVRQAPAPGGAPGSMPSGAPTSTHHSGMSASGVPKPQGGGLNIVDKPHHGK